MTDTWPVPLNVASPDCAEDFFAGPAARCVILWRAAGLAVFGTRKPLLKSHSNSAGFDPAFAHLLTVSRPPGAPFSR